MVEEDGALELVELRGVVGDLGEEGVGHEDIGLAAMAGVGVAEKGGDVDLEGLGETVERGERGHRFAVLDLRDVGARNVHARGKLALGEIADVTEVADGGGDLGSAFSGRCLADEGDGSGDGFGLLDFEAFAAAAAHCAGGAELHQIAMVATQNLTLFDGCHHSCHSCVQAGGSRARTSAHVR